MSSTEMITATPPAGDTSGTPAPIPAGSEMNAVPAGDAVKEKKSKIPGAEAPEKKPSGKGSRSTPSMARTVAPQDKEEDKEGKTGEVEGEESKEGGGSDAESEYETICVRRKKPKPFFEQLKRFLANYFAFCAYMSNVMWEAFKIVIITSQFNWALEILAGVLHIMVSATKCALKRECDVGERRRKSDSSETDVEKTPEPESKKSSVRASGAGKPSNKPSTGGAAAAAGGPSGSLNKSASKAGPTTSEPTTTTTSTTESGEPKTATSEGPAAEPTSAAEGGEAASPTPP